jgi:hypothetical protein
MLLIPDNVLYSLNKIWDISHFSFTCYEKSIRLRKPASGLRVGGLHYIYGMLRPYKYKCSETEEQNQT